MASAPRDYVKDEPVLVTTRCVLRVPFLKMDAMKTELRRQIAKWAPKCGVEVLAFTFIGNHIDMILSQDHTGIDSRRKRGIAWFLRNVLSYVARYGNALHSSQGHFVERRYLSRRRPSPEEALQSLAYILEHPVNHDVPGGFEDVNTSGRLYLHGTADGVATAVLGLFLLRDPEARWTAIENLFREMYSDPRWKTCTDPENPKERVEVAREAIARHPEVIDKWAWCVPIRVALWAGEEAARRARHGVLTAPQERVEFSARRMPRIGGVIEVVFREAPPRPMPLQDSS